MDGTVEASDGRDRSVMPRRYMVMCRVSEVTVTSTLARSHRSKRTRKDGCGWAVSTLRRMSSLITASDTCAVSAARGRGWKGSVTMARVVACDRDSTVQAAVMPSRTPLVSQPPPSANEGEGRNHEIGSYILVLLMMMMMMMMIIISFTYLMKTTEKTQLS